MNSESYDLLDRNAGELSKIFGMDATSAEGQ